MCEAVLKSFAWQIRLLCYLQIFFVSLQLRPKSCIGFCHWSGSLHSLGKRRNIVEARVGIIQVDFLPLRLLRRFTWVLIWPRNNKQIFW